jgi:predicted MFS family arabinose efflux permease
MVALAVVVLSGGASIWMVFAVAFVITVGEILVDPSVVAAVPTIVDKGDLDRANGRISSVEIVTNDLVGAPVGAVLFTAAPWLPFVADGLTYLGSIVPFRRLPARPKPAKAPLDLGTALAEVPEGMAWLLRHPMLRPWTGAVAVFNIGAAAGFSLLVVLVKDTFEASNLSFAVVLTAAAVGAAISSSVAARLVDRFGRPAVLLTSAGLSAVTLVAVGGASTLWLAAALWGFNGALAGVLMAIGRGYVQRYCPEVFLGRAAIASRTITRTAFVVGALVGGVVAERFDVRVSFVVAGLVQGVALLPMAVAMRHDHHQPELSQG